MSFYENNEVANILIEKINQLLLRKLKDKKLIEVKSGGLNNAIKCYYFVDGCENRIIRTKDDKKEHLNLYDVEILFVKWTYEDDIIEDDLYIVDIKEYRIFNLITDCETSKTDFLDTLSEDKDCKEIFKIYTYDDKTFKTIEDIIIYEKEKGAGRNEIE